MEPVARTAVDPGTRLDGGLAMAASGVRESRPLSLRFRQYRLESVYLDTTAGQRAEISEFWLREHAIADPREAERRAGEVVLMVRRDGSGELAGVSTVALRRLRDGRLVYAYRMFLREQDRVPHLMRAVTDASRDFLRTFPPPQAPTVGMLIVAESRKLMRPGLRRPFQRHGYRYLCQNRRGQDLWLAEFGDSPAGS